MSFLTTVESPFKWAEGKAEWAYAHIVPAALQAEIGVFAHTFTANLVHDAGDLAKTLTTEAVQSVWSVIKASASNLVPEVLSGKVGFGAAVSAGVSALKSDFASTIVPALKVTSEQTIQNWLPNLLTTALAAASSNPTSAVANSSAAPSPVSPSA